MKQVVWRIRGDRPGTHRSYGAQRTASSSHTPRHRRRRRALLTTCAALMALGLLALLTAHHTSSPSEGADALEEDFAATDEVPPKRKAMYTVLYIMPARHSSREERTAQTLALEMLVPLLAREEALCHRRSSSSSFPSDESHSPQWRLKVVVVTDTAPHHPALVELLSGIGAVPAPRPAQVLSEAHVRNASVPSASDVVTAWTADRKAVLHFLAAQDPSLVRNGVGCYEGAITLASASPGANATEDDEGSTVVHAEFYVEAALRTRAAAAEVVDYFLVVPSFIVPTRAPFTFVGEDVSETRQEPFGFVETLLLTATRRNDGRVSAVQCAILSRTSDSTAHNNRSPAPGGEATNLFQQPSSTPLTHAQLSHHTVMDRGGFIGSTVATTAQGSILLPFLSRRYAGLIANDQRVLAEEPIDAVSLHCGLFHKTVYEAAGGLAAALVDFPTLARQGTGADAIHAAADSAGWKLSLRMQEVRPAWQVYASRAVAVWQRPRAEALGALERGLPVCVFALADAYGRAHHRTLQRLQTRRFGLGWRQRLAPLASPTRRRRAAASNGRASGQRSASAGPLRGATLPPIVTLLVDYQCTCCGLARESFSYVRPLMDRYAVFAPQLSDHCGDRGAAAAAMAYSGHRTSVFREPDAPTLSFWAARAAERARVNFLHVRAPRYEQFLVRHYLWNGAAAPLALTIGRSLSEFSNVPPDWARALWHRPFADQLWVTGDLFRGAYAHAGVPADRIRVVPLAVDVYTFDPANVEPLPLPLPLPAAGMWDSEPNLSAAERRRRYVFLSNFKWEPRKGWDVLLGAYCDAFGPGAPPEWRRTTTLIVKTHFDNEYAEGFSLSSFPAYWRAAADALVGTDADATGRAELPHLVVVDAPLPTAALIRLYRTADAFVLPSRAEGWGLPAAEAMAMALPTLVTGWGGFTGFATNETAFFIPVDGLEPLPPAAKALYGDNEGKRWAVPSRNGTAALMRFAATHPAEAREVGRLARQRMVTHFSEEVVADEIDRHIAASLRGKVQERRPRDLLHAVLVDAGLSPSFRG